jgi:hypothetical protein
LFYLLLSSSSTRALARALSLARAFDSFRVLFCCLCFCSLAVPRPLPLGAPWVLGSFHGSLGGPWLNRGCRIQRCRRERGCRERFLLVPALLVWSVSLFCLIIIDARARARTFARARVRMFPLGGGGSGGCSARRFYCFVDPKKLDPESYKLDQVLSTCVWRRRASRRRRAFYVRLLRALLSTCVWRRRASRGGSGCGGSSRAEGTAQRRLWVTALWFIKNEHNCRMCCVTPKGVLLLAKCNASATPGGH